jgi:hypothetical protein
VRQYFRGEDRIALLFLLADDLQQNPARNVGVGSGIDDVEAARSNTNCLTFSRVM